MAWFFRNRVPWAGGRLLVDPAVCGARTVASAFFGFYEHSERRLIRRHLLDIDTVELGSSVGGVTAESARKLGRQRALVCVEANPNLQWILAQNIQSFASHLKVLVVPKAVAYSGTLVKFSIAANSSDSRLSQKDGDDGSISIEAVSLRELPGVDAMNRCQLVCDIEGGEWDIVANEHELLSRCERIIAEVHGANMVVSFDRFCDCLSKLGFRLLGRDGYVGAFGR